jgi:rod shape-determining protein MreD
MQRAIVENPARPYTRACRSDAPRGLGISYIGPLLAVVMGIVHAAIAPVIVVGGVKPNLVLIAVVLVTAFGGFLPGITWAFVAGLTANLLVGEPLGSIPLAMLVVAALTAGGARVIGRVPLVYPVLAAFAGSVVADLLLIGLGQLVGDAVVAELPGDIILSAAVLNAVICAVIVVPARAIATRFVADEAGTW